VEKKKSGGVVSCGGDHRCRRDLYVRSRQYKTNVKRGNMSLEVFHHQRKGNCFIYFQKIIDIRSERRRSRDAESGRQGMVEW